MIFSELTKIPSPSASNSAIIAANSSFIPSLLFFLTKFRQKTVSNSPWLVQYLVFSLTFCPFYRKRFFYAPGLCVAILYLNSVLQAYLAEKSCRSIIKLTWFQGFFVRAEDTGFSLKDCININSIIKFLLEGYQTPFWWLLRIITVWGKFIDNVSK